RDQLGKGWSNMPQMDHVHLDRFAGESGDGRSEYRAGATRAERTGANLGAGRSEDAGELFRRARFLMPDDRLLIELAFKNQMSLRQIARATGRPAGSISRRLVRLCARLRDPSVLVIIDPAFPVPLSPEHRQLAV